MVAPLGSLDQSVLEAMTLYRRARVKVLELRKQAAQLHTGYWVFHTGTGGLPLGCPCLCWRRA